MLSSPDSELCGRDIALPGLRLLLDPDALRETVEAMGERMPVLQNASPSYLRYKPGTNCLVGFSASSESPICFYGKVFPPGSSKLRARHGSTPLGGHRLTISDEGIELVFFPADNKLALAPALDPGLLSRLKPEGERHYVADESVSSTVLAYRPERRCVIAVGHGDRTGVVKAYAAREFPASVARANAFSDESAKTPPLAMVDSANRLMLSPWTPGRLLQRSIEDRTISADDLYAAGVALAELHARRVRSLPLRGKAAEAHNLRAIASMVGRLCPSLDQLAQCLAERMIERLDFMDWNEATLHGDFGAKQVVVDNGRATLIDLDEAATGNGAIDLGNFTARMEADALLDRITFEHIPSSCSALLAGYAAMKKLPGEAELILATAIGLFRVAHEPFRSHVPDWPERMSALLLRVNAMLEGMPLEFSEHSAAGSLS